MTQAQVFAPASSLPRIALLSALCLAPFGAAFAQAAIAHAARPGPFELRVAAGKFEEVCIPMKTGQAFAFRFLTDAPVDFNVHSHEGSRVETAVDAKGVMKQTGEVVAKSSQAHCMTWTAPPGRDVGVSGTWQPLEKQ